MSKTVRQRTRAIVKVHSHVAGEVSLSNDVIRIQTSKSIKGAGHFQLHLVPRRNYFNYLFPNDVVNIYFDPGDGERGFVRTVMGYVDRVERQEMVDPQTGAMTTGYVVSGSDFLKAVERTDI